ncbi:MAG TPA: hypothetical protein PKK23_11340 [Nitrospirales bacterium]|nr:hypothetical protein [Nitrospirales bacterium]
MSLALGLTKGPILNGEKIGQIFVGFGPLRLFPNSDPQDGIPQGADVPDTSIFKIKHISKPNTSIGNSVNPFDKGSKP